MSITSIAGQAEFESVREQMTRALYEGMPQPDRTLIARLLARAFIDECVAAWAAGEAPDLQSWIDATLAKPGRAAAAAAVVAAALKAGVRLAECGVPVEFFAQLSALDRSEASSETSHPGSTLQMHLDETEADIAELLVRLEKRAPVAAERARSVAAWSERIARRLAFSEEETRFIARCGSLHGFNDAELAERGRLAPFLPVVRAHRAARKTSSPASQTRGEEAMALRVVAVALAFNEAIVGSTARQPLSPPAAARSLAAAGLRYDAVVVAALRDLIDRR